MNGLYPNETQACGANSLTPRSETLTERLTAERDRLYERTCELDSLLKQLDAHPEVKSILDAVQKLSRIY